MAMHLVAFFAGTAIETVRSRFGPRRAIQRTTRKTSEILLIPAPETPAMTPEFYLVLNAADLTEELENAVYEAGFDDSSLIMRGGKAAIWICHREGELMQVIREALQDAHRGGVNV